MSSILSECKTNGKWGNLSEFGSSYRWWLEKNGSKNHEEERNKRIKDRFPNLKQPEESKISLFPKIAAVKMTEARFFEMVEKRVVKDRKVDFSAIPEEDVKEFKRMALELHAQLAKKISAELSIADNFEISMNYVLLGAKRYHSTMENTYAICDDIVEKNFLKFDANFFKKI